MDLERLSVGRCRAAAWNGLSQRLGGPRSRPVETVDVPSGGQYAARRVQGTFRFNWDMRHYPFDRQEVVIPIDKAAYGAERVVFEPMRANRS